LFLTGAVECAHGRFVLASVQPPIANAKVEFRDLWSFFYDIDGREQILNADPVYDFCSRFYGCHLLVISLLLLISRTAAFDGSQ
jgi:hypothetical protein